MKKFYFSFAKFVVEKYKYIIFFTFIISLIFISNIPKLQVNSDILKILPPDDPIVREYIEEIKSQTETGGILIVVIYLNPSNDPSEIMKYIYKRAEKLPQFKGFAKTDISLLASYGLLYIANSQLLMDISDSVINAVNSLSKVNPYDFKTVEYMYDTMKKLKRLGNIFKEAEQKDPYMAYYAVSPDKKLMIVGLLFKEGSTNLSFVERLISSVKDLKKELKSKFRVDVKLTGAYMTAFEANKTVTFDFQITTIISIIFIMTIFLLSFGNLLSTFIVFGALIVSIGITLGLVQIIFKQLNVITSFVASITLGLGIDYGIHLVTRLITEFRDRKNFFEALFITYDTVFLQIIYGALTTILVFLSLFFMKLPAFVEMAVISSLGLIVFVFIMTIFVPAFMYMFRKRIVKSFIGNKVNEAFMKFSYFIPQKRKIILIIILFVILIFSPFGIKNIMNFYYTVPNLIPSSAESVIAGKDIVRHFGGQLFDRLQFLVGFDENIDKFVEELRNKKVIKNVESFMDMVQNQLGNFAQIKERINQISMMLTNPFVISVMKKYGIYSETLKLVNLIATSKDIKEFSFKIVDLLPDDLKKMFVYEKGGKRYFVLYITPSIPIYSENGLKKFYDELGELGWRILGGTKASYRVMKMMESRFPTVAFIAAVMIGIITLMARKNIVEMGVSLTGLLLSTLVAFGFSYFFDIRTTFMSIMSFPLLFGVGIDGYIHIYHSVDEDKTHYWHTIKATTLSYLTTISAFLSFLLSRGELLRAFSLTMIWGLVSVWVMTVLLIPSLKSKDLIK